MSARQLRGYVVKLPDGTRHGRTREPRSFDAAREIANEYPFGEAWVTPVFATRKPRPAPVGCTLVNGLCDRPTCGEHYPKPAPVAPVAPVVAAEGLFGCLHVDDSGIAFEVLWKGHADTVRDAGTREESVAAVEKWGGKLVRILDDGEHEAALAAARREERERCLRILDWSYGNIDGVSGAEREAKRRAHMADPTFNVREPGLHAHDCPECRAVWECFESTCPQTNDVSKQGLWMSDDMICEACESKIPDEDEAAEGQAK